MEICIEVELLMNLKEYAHKKEEKFRITFETSITIDQLINELNLPKDILLATVNGEITKFDAIIVNNDRVKFLPIIGGG